MKTMKIVIASCLMVAFVSCDTLNQKYWMGYDAAEINTPAKIRSAAVGMYDMMQHLDFLGGRAQIYVDIRSNDTNPSAYFGPLSSMDGSMTASHGINQEAWAGAYRTLFEINFFIENLTANKGVLPEDEEEMYINEAKFLRGVVHFYILNFWGDQYTRDGSGLGIPYIERSFDGASGFSDEALIPRSTTAEVYEKIITDITAGTNLPASRGTEGKSLYFATSGAAWAMLSRVYLYMEDYANVITSVANVTGYDLDTNPAAETFVLPPTSSREIIFWIAHNNTDNPNTNNALGQHYGMNSRGDINISSNYIALFDQENDIRFKDLIVQNAGGSYFTNKYPNGSYNWAPIIRYGEVILNEAEARAKQATGVDATAITLLNRIRTRAGLTPEKTAADFATKDNLVNFILEERRRELGFEGHGSFDLFRNKKGIAAGRASELAAEIAYPNNLFAMPIPGRDIINGKGVVIQNPGY